MFTVKATERKTLRQRVSELKQPPLRTLMQLARFLQEKKANLKFRKDQFKCKAKTKLQNARFRLRARIERAKEFVNSLKPNPLIGDVPSVVPKWKFATLAASVGLLQLKEEDESAVVAPSKTSPLTDCAYLAGQSIKALSVAPSPASPTILSASLNSFRAVNTSSPTSIAPIQVPNLLPVSLSSPPPLQLPRAALMDADDPQSSVEHDVEDDTTPVVAAESVSESHVEIYIDHASSNADDAVDLLTDGARVSMTPGVPSWIQSVVEHLPSSTVLPVRVEDALWSAYAHSTKRSKKAAAEAHVPGTSAAQRNSASVVRNQVLLSVQASHAMQSHNSDPVLPAKPSQPSQPALPTAASVLDKMRARMHPVALRMFALTLSGAFRTAFERLCVHNRSLIESLVRMQQLRTDVSVVLVPTHTSHLDYLLLSYVCFAFGLKMPHIAAGDNLNLPLLGSYLQHCGAFFIRRSYRNAPLAKQVCAEYTRQMLRHQHTLEFFIEGGRSRNGRLRAPRLGFVNWAVEAALLDVTAPDVLLVPVAIGYDHVWETETYARESLGEQKQPESLMQVIGASCSFVADAFRSSLSSLASYISSPWSRSEVDAAITSTGEVHVRFGLPISVRAEWSRYLVQRATSARRLMELFNPVNVGPAAVQSVQLAVEQLHGSNSAAIVTKLSQRLATELMLTLGNECPVSATALLSFTLLSRSSLSFLDKTIGAHVESPVDQCLSQSLGLAGQVYDILKSFDVHFAFPRYNLNSQLIRSFRRASRAGLIDVVHGEPRPSASVEKRLQLTYSRNALLQPIILPALIAVGALISVARGASNIDSSSCLCVERSSVLQHAFDVGQLIVAELPFPKLTLELLQSALMRCETANCLVPADESWLRCDIRMLLVLHAAIAPILESYFVLMRTVPAAIRSVSVKQETSTVDEQALLQFIQRLLRASASPCAEEQSFEMIKNVMRVLQQRRIICIDDSRKHFSLPPDESTWLPTWNHLLQELASIPLVTNELVTYVCMRRPASGSIFVPSPDDDRYLWLSTCTAVNSSGDIA